jgi:hypothetical protein
MVSLDRFSRLQYGKNVTSPVKGLCKTFSNTLQRRLKAWERPTKYPLKALDTFKTHPQLHFEREFSIK